MSASRREFIERLSATAVLGALPLSELAPTAADLVAGASGGAEEWDMSWTARVAGKKHRACFDCAEHDNGVGAWRASLWEQQYESALGAARADIVTVLILRHVAAVLALKQELWDRYGIGKDKNVKHPTTDQVTDRNPILLTAQDGMPPMIDSFALPNFLARGGVVLACGAALRNWSGNVARKDGVSADEAYKRVLAGVYPGVIVQPSGVFAAVRAQQEGCAYVRAS